jgi:glycosidase
MSKQSTWISQIDKVKDNLKIIRGGSSLYYIPDVWLPGNYQISHSQTIAVNPAEFFKNVLQYFRKHKNVDIEKQKDGKWSTHAVIYNLFVRTTCAFDHDQNGSIDLPLNKEGWRETGTFMKAIALIPYMRSLGANTIHLLPITAIGSDGNKGTLGSPYAIKNPYRLDEKLNEPNCGLTTEEEFLLFVDAAHHLGMRVVVEFVFRTASKDADWITEHPEWFYWIKENVPDRASHSHDENAYGNPIFTKEELNRILSDVENGNLNDLIQPHTLYRDIFAEPPKQGAVKAEDGRLIGRLKDGTRVRIPGAFADWPPDDSQPPWGDVTYLRMYQHPDFNYIAYNTIRMYDTRLAKSQNMVKELWEKIIEIIPYYQRSFGIDGVMIDMGHALPMELKSEMISRARSIDPDFAFWDENFSVDEKSVKEGYDAVIGYQWSDQHHPRKFQNLLKRFTGEGYALPFFATPESHNTPRAAARDGGLIYSKYAWAVGCFLPAIPFIHSGFEIGETIPINTGLDFTRDELKKYPSDKLPLFSEYAYDWKRKDQIRDWITMICKIRRKYEKIIIDKSRESFKWIETGQNDVLCFLRQSMDEQVRLVIIANTNMNKSAHYSIHIDQKGKIKDLITETAIILNNGTVTGTLKRGQVLVCLLE